MERRQFLGALAGAIDGRWIHMTSFPSTHLSHDRPNGLIVRQLDGSAISEPTRAVLQPT
jgi:hypothetical protein